jgi:hypothetical protein
VVLGSLDGCCIVLHFSPSCPGQEGDYSVVPFPP